MAHMCSSINATVVILAILGAACDATQGPPDAVVFEDSAGIPIVENVSPQWDSTTAWHLAERPSLQLGVVDGSETELFHRIVDLALPADGRIWVANGGDQTIRIFDADGAHLRTLAGEGQGPGEFSGLSALSVRDNRIYADQGLRGPLAIYAADGSLQTTPFLRSAYDLRAPALAGIVSDSRSVWAVVMHYPQGEPVQVGLFEQETPVYLLPLEDGESIDLGVFPAARFFGVANTRMANWQEFTPSLHVATCSNSILIGWPVTSEIRKYTPAGRLDRIVRWDRSPSPVTEAQRQASRDRFLTFPEGVQIPDRARARQEALANGMAYPEHHPSYRRVLCDSEDRAWIQHEDPDIAWSQDVPDVPLVPTLWDIIDRDGRWLGTVQTPERFTPMAISADRVAGRYVSDGDVHFVRIFDLIQPGT